jgi:hypothetical protein
MYSRSTTFTTGVRRGSAALMVNSSCRISSNVGLPRHQRRQYTRGGSTPEAAVHQRRQYTRGGSTPEAAVHQRQQGSGQGEQTRTSAGGHSRGRRSKQLYVPSSCQPTQGQLSQCNNRPLRVPCSGTAHHRSMTAQGHQAAAAHTSSNNGAGARLWCRQLCRQLTSDPSWAASSALPGPGSLSEYHLGIWAAGAPA